MVEWLCWVLKSWDFASMLGGEVLANMSGSWGPCEDALKP